MKADVVVSYTFAPVPKEVQGAFTRPTRFVSIPTPANRGYKKQAQSMGWPHPIKTAIQRYAPDVEPQRVALLGFSESCHGVRNLLSSGDGAAVDAVIAIDGIHTPYIGNKQVDPNTMLPWVEFGKYALLNERLFVDTHSSVVPPGYASTTETAQYLWKLLTGESTSFTVPKLPNLSIPPAQVKISGSSPQITGPARVVDYPEAPWNSLNRANGLVVLGCKNLDARGTTDHIYQAKYVLPMVITQFLANRWNNIPPEGSESMCFVGGANKGWLNGFGVGFQQACAHTHTFDGSTATPLVPVESKSVSAMKTATKVLVGLFAAMGLLYIYSEKKQAWSVK